MWCGLTWEVYNVLWFDMVLCGLWWRGLVWGGVFDMVWFGLVWCGCCVV